MKTNKTFKGFLVHLWDHHAFVLAFLIGWMLCGLICGIKSGSWSRFWWFILFLALPCLAQTNWPAYRVVSNQVYNVALSTKWTTIAPTDGRVKLAPALKPGQRVLLEASWNRRRIEIEHFEYHPEDFRMVRGEQPVTKYAFSCRVFYLGSRTNYNGAGVVRDVTDLYDYGLPVGVAK